MSDDTRFPAKNKDQTVDEWANELADNLAEESFGILMAQEKFKGVPVTNILLCKYIARFMCIAVWETLHTQPIKVMSKKEQSDFTISNYKKMKSSVAEAIAVGFQGAFTEFTHKPVEYFCQISPVPAPINSKPC